MTESLDYATVLSEIFRVEKITTLIVLFIILYGIIHVLKKVARQLSARFPRNKNTILQISALINFAISMVGTGSILYWGLKPSREVILAVLGSASVAVGLSLKETVASLISGITIILDPPFRIGDRIYFHQHYGEVKNIGLRSVKIMTIDNQIVTIPNSSFTTDVVICQNPNKNHLNVVTPFFLNVATDVELATAILKEVVVTSPYAHLGEIIEVLVEHVTFADVVAAKFLVKAHVTNATFERVFQTDIYNRGIKELIKNGISTAFLYKPEHPKLLKSA
jgi:small-conductance mechanosensitive channel